MLAWMAQRLIFFTNSRLEVTLRRSSCRRRHQEALPPSPTTGAAVHLVGAMHGEPRAGVGENRLATSRRDCCCWGGGAGEEGSCGGGLVVFRRCRRQWLLVQARALPEQVAAAWRRPEGAAAIGDWCTRAHSRCRKTRGGAACMAPMQVGERLRGSYGGALGAGMARCRYEG